MSIDTAGDLTTATDAQLDAALRVGYAAHRNASPEDRLELHLAIQAIIIEQTARLDAWLAHQAAAPMRATSATDTATAAPTQPGSSPTHPTVQPKPPR